MDEQVRELHRDLANKFRSHGPRVEKLWRSFSQQQREKIMRDGAYEGVVLKGPNDTSMGNVYKIMPEWNLREIAAPSSDFLLDMLKHRTSTTLQEQYATGLNGRHGDHAHVVDMMKRKNLQLVHAAKYKDCYTLFVDEEKYGQSIKFIPDKKDEFLDAMVSAVQAQLIVSQHVGELVLMRQLYLLQSLNMIFEDILDAASTIRVQTKHPKKPLDAPTPALAELSLHSSPRKIELSDLVDSALDQKSSLEDYINLICTEPSVLAHEVNTWFSTRPELLSDENGRFLPVNTDKYIGEAVFDAVHGAVKTAAVWNHILRLLDLLKNSPEKQLRTIVLQELSNTCHLEYVRAQAMFKRNVAAVSGGSKWFKRMSIVRSDGIVRISLKRSPECLAAEDPQLHCMLRLCQDEMTWDRSTEWLGQLEDLHRIHPLEREKMAGPEFDSLGDLAIIVTFMRSISSVAKMPTPSNKKEHSFVSRYSALENELRELKSGLDFSDFAIPINNLMEPKMADGALTKLNNYILEKTGTKLGFLYQDLVKDCVTNIQNQYERQKTGEPKEGCVMPAAPDSPEAWIQQRREKDKTRPSRSSTYEITPKGAKTNSSSEIFKPRQRLIVKPITHAVFSSLLAKSPAAREPISWGAFAAAMADMGFSVIPKVGSIYTFLPPEKVAAQKPLTLHRPHQPFIEGPRLLFYCRRLRREYGWDSETFVLA